MPLILGNCVTALQKLPSQTVDLTVTSPPYDNLRTYNGNNDSWTNQVWKDCIAQLYRVTKTGGVVVWIVNDATINGSETGTSFKQALWAIRCGFKLHDTMIWDKGLTTSPCPTRYGSSFEYMFIWSKHPPKHVTLITDRKTKYPGGKFHGTRRERDGTLVRPVNDHYRVPNYAPRYNVWRIPPCNSKLERTGHPAQFSEQLITDHIISWSSRGDTVLDPFMGSGTTGVVAKRLDRNFIGIELEPTYFEVASNRISMTPSPKTVNVPNLFSTQA